MLFGRTTYLMLYRLLIGNFSDPDVCYDRLLQMTDLLRLHPFLLPLSQDVQFVSSLVQVLQLSTPILIVHPLLLLPHLLHHVTLSPQHGTRHH